VARLWGVDAVPATPGKTAVELFQAAADGEVKALWIACTNPAQSMPDQATVRRALQRAEFVVLQEAYATTATAPYADLLLPATSWGEKDGTRTNSERRISRVRAAVPAPGEARDDWRIARDIARRLELRLRPGRPTLFPYDSAQAVWREHRESTRGRDLDITGLDWLVLERQGPQCWPMPQGAEQGTERLYTDFRFATDDGRARFFDAPFVPLAEPRDARFPFSLTTGRLRDQWHGMSRTGTLGRLFGHVPEPTVELHPSDAARLGLADGALAQVTSRRGTLLLPVQTTTAVAPAQAFIAMHWGEEFVGGQNGQGEPLQGVNALTTGAFCPISKQPELKHAAVKVVRAELPWRLIAAAWLPDNRAPRALAALRALLPRFGFATCVPFGRERSGVLLRAAAYEAPAAALLDDVQAALGLAEGEDGERLLRYDDPRRGQRRRLRLVPDAGDWRLDGLLLAGDTSAEAWIRGLLDEGSPTGRFGRQLLQAGATPPVAVVDRGRQVCACLDVREPQILEALAVMDERGEAARVEALQQRLRCGTQCGSCLPTLKRMALQPVVAPASA
jgi:assimilatory nitrate reductase catalytic subunit